MRVVLDTNILISALIIPGRAPDLLYQGWKDGRFTLITSTEQLDEFRRVTRYPKLKIFIEPSKAGAMFNKLRQLAFVVDKLPHVAISKDPADNFVLAMAVAGGADFLVTGDKRDLLRLRRVGRTRIVSVNRFLNMLPHS
jgi:uncharacterized protein